MAAAPTVPTGFPALLSSIKTMLDQHEPKRALDVIFGDARSYYSAFKPSQTETKEFITLLRKAMEEEKKTFSFDRQSALTLVSLYNMDPGIAHFTGVNPHKFAFQLALRVREPNLISQGELGICGANAPIIHFAKTNPKGYVNLGIDLMKKGKGMFGQAEIEPGSTIRAGVMKLNLAEADYVVLASVRGSGNFLDKVTNSKNGIALGMPSDEVCKLLKEAGYTDVEDHVHTFGTTDWDRNIEKAALHVDLARLVMISINKKLVDVMKDDKQMKVDAIPKDQRMAKAEVVRSSGSGDVTPPKRSTTDSNHWVLVSKLIVSDTEVTIKLYSWGQSLKRTMPKKNFLSYYDGFVSAKLGGESAPEVPPC